VNSSDRSRPPIKARARGSPARIQLGRTQSGRLDPESSSLLVLGRRHDSWSQSLSVSGRAVRPVSACDQPDRTYISSNDLSALATVSGLVGDSDCKREFQFPLTVFVHPIGRQCTNSACLASSSCVCPSFGRERQSQQCHVTTAGSVDHIGLERVSVWT